MHASDLAENVHLQVTWVYVSVSAVQCLKWYAVAAIFQEHLK